MQAMAYLGPAEGGVLVDASCGTGLFTRLFARSQKFKGVVALDFRCGLLMRQGGVEGCHRQQSVCDM
jgi:ubiquinone/menaquinone biosynthesis C-methylase UbiE